MDEFELGAADGTRIPVCHWPQSRPRAVLMILHGMSEYAARYARFAEFLGQQGIAVIAHDHRGHGQSPIAQGNFAAENGWQHVCADVECVRQAAAQRYPNTPIFLMGHSMGSFIARAVWLQDGAHYAGLILSATGYRQSLIARVMRGVSKWLGVGRMSEPSRVMERLVFGSFNLNFFPARTRVDWLSRDAQEVDRYIADPLCGFAPSWQLWHDLFGGIIALESGEKAGFGLPVNLPVLLMTGSRDPVGMGKLAPAQLEKRYRAAGVRDVRQQVWAGGRHEMLNETNRDEVMQFVADWLLDRLALSA